VRDRKWELEPEVKGSVAKLKRMEMRDRVNVR
jgi:hypothetical protein